jgi:isoquinoline 1-oxidoreductase subunit beta
VLTFDQRHTSVATDFTHGLGEILSATLGDLPEGDFLGYSQSVFTLTANVPYNFGPVTQLLNEVYHPPGSVFNTSSVRNIYSPEVTVAKELMVDQVAAAMRQDPYQFRRSFVRDPRILAVLDTAATAANWGTPMAPLTAQGIGVHHEYKAPNALGAARSTGCPRTEVRLRPGRLQSLHLPHQWQGLQPVLGAGQRYSAD